MMRKTVFRVILTIIALFLLQPVFADAEVPGSKAEIDKQIQLNSQRIDELSRENKQLAKELARLEALSQQLMKKIQQQDEVTKTSK